MDNVLHLISSLATTSLQQLINDSNEDPASIASTALPVFFKFLIGSILSGILVKIQQRRSIVDYGSVANWRGKRKGTAAGLLLVGELLSSLGLRRINIFNATIVDIIVPILLLSICTAALKPKRSVLSLTAALVAAILFSALAPRESSTINVIATAARGIGMTCRCIGLLFMLREINSTKEIPSAMFGVYSLGVIPAIVAVLATSGLPTMLIPQQLTLSLYVAFASLATEYYLAAIVISSSLAYAACQIPLTPLVFVVNLLYPTATLQSLVISALATLAILGALPLLENMPDEAIFSASIALDKSPSAAPAPKLRRRSRRWPQLIMTPLSIYLYAIVHYSLSMRIGQVHALASMMKPSSFESMRGIPEHYVYTGPASISGENFTFSEFLEERFPRNASTPPHIWMSLGGAGYERSIAGQQLFVDDLNLERYEKSKRNRRTEFVVLCMTQACTDFCQREGIWSYGGYRFNRPEQILEYTWPKLKGTIDLLTTGRDCFFVDADVFWKLDPYPFMPLETADFILADNFVMAHANTGWLYLRSIPANIAVYQTVLDLDMESTSRDQLRTNEVLGTAGLRKIEGSDKLKMDFISANVEYPATNGIRVHILDPILFRHFHYEFELASASQHESVFLHMTCGNDDASQREYIARILGFGSDVESYYSNPPKILKIQDAYGTAKEVVHKMAVLFAAAHYSDRAAMPPLLGIFSDLYTPPLPSDPPRDSQDLQRYIYSLFPITSIGEALNVTIIEADYVEHATERILRPLNSHMHEQIAVVRSLQSAADIDLRSVHSFGDLIRLLRTEVVANAQVVNIKNFDWSKSYMQWKLPMNVRAFETCYDVRTEPACGQLCRWAPDGNGKVKVGLHEWESIEDVLAMR